MEDIGSINAKDESWDILGEHLMDMVQRTTKDNIVTGKINNTGHGNIRVIMFVEHGDNINVVTPQINEVKILSTINNVQNNIDGENYDVAISIIEDLKLSFDNIIEKLINWNKRKLERRI